LHEHKIAVFAQLFQALLHKLLSGEITIDDLDLGSRGAARVAPEAAQ
jgi:hypothetical protein